MADDEQALEPRRIDLTVQVPFGASQTYGSDWIAYAQSTDAPLVAGVDAALDPTFHDPTAGEGETRYA